MSSHITVLLEEAVASLNLEPNSTVIDATYGAGGHANWILEILSQEGTYIGIDVDPTALEMKPNNPNQATVHLVNQNFSHLETILRSLHIESVDGILADLGWRIEQFETGAKGLSFQKDEPLIMTYGEASEYSFTAYDIVNEWEEAVLADIIFGYGEERAARRIAKAIIEARSSSPIETTFQLRDLVASTVKSRPGYQKTHPATKTFQAIRIAVNQELQVLDTFINAAVEALSPGGRLAIITFHSLEDRMVKQSFRQLKDRGLATLVFKKPVPPSADEVQQNPRARSAKLRVIEKNNVEQYDQDNQYNSSL